MYLRTLAKNNWYFGAALALIFTLISHSNARAQVKIGFLGGFSGQIESMAPPIFDGARLAVEQINAAGGTRVGKVQIASADSACDSTAGANSADVLVNSNAVIGIVGALCTGATSAAAINVAVPAGVVMISPASTSPAITTLNDNDLVFRSVGSDAYQAQILAKLLLSKNINTVAVTFVNNEYGTPFSNNFDEAYSAGGGNVTVSLPHEDNKADYRAEIGTLESSGADTLLILAYADGSGKTILTQAIESGVFANYAGADGMVSDTLVENIGAANLATFVATKPGAADLPGKANFVTAAEKFGLDPDAIYAAQAYDAAFVLALAIEKNGANSKVGLNAALREVGNAPGEVIYPGEWRKASDLIAAGQDINYEGAAGNLDFDAQGDVSGGVIIEMAVRNGAFTEIGVIE